MNTKIGYDLDEIGGEPLLDSGFEQEEPNQTDELESDVAESGFRGSAA